MRLVTVAHGTRHPTGNEVAVELTRRAGSRLGLPAQAAYVELCAPLLGEALAAGGPAVVVPLLLSTGYHVRVDIPAVLREAAPTGAGSIPLHTSRPLGPDPLLAAAQVERLLAAGAAPGQPVVLVAAGSNDPSASADLHTAAGLLASHWGGPVRLATLSGLGPRVADVVRDGDAVSTYLLAPGFFATRAETVAREAGASVVAAPLGAHPLLVDLLVARASALLGQERASA